MKIRTLFAVFVLGLAFCSSAYAATFNIAVTPGGDGWWGKDRWGYSSWYNAGDSTGNEVGGFHKYEDGDGQYRTGYLEFGLAQYTGNTGDITSITLNYNLLRTAGDGDVGDINHVADSSSATGAASDKLNGSELVETISGGTPSGWKSVDVTSYVLNDLTQGYAWSAFSLNRKSYSGYYISSAESLNPAFLAITTTAATPIPGALWLLGTGIAGLIGLRRKAKA